MFSIIWLLFSIASFGFHAAQAQLCPDEDINCPGNLTWTQLEAGLVENITKALQSYKSFVTKLQYNLVHKDVSFFEEPIDTETKTLLESFAQSLGSAAENATRFRGELDAMLECTMRSLAATKLKEGCLQKIKKAITDQSNDGRQEFSPQFLVETKQKLDRNAARLVAVEYTIEATISHRQKLEVLLTKLIPPVKYILQTLANGANLKQQIDVGTWLDSLNILKPMTEIAAFLSKDLAIPIEPLLPPLLETDSLQSQLEVVIDRITGKERLAILALKGKKFRDLVISELYSLLRCFRFSSTKSSD